MTEHHEHPVVERHCDVAVIGGSAAGLAAALQLARQRRSVLVVDDGTPRNAPADHMHGYLGREGLPPAELVEIGREEVRGYGGEVLAGRVLAVTRHDDRFRLDLSGGHVLFARRVLLASGIVDELPGIEGLAEQWGRGAINCPFCHGYEVRDQRLVQIVTHPMGLHSTPVWRHLTDRLTVVLMTEADPPAGVTVVRQAVTRIETRPDGQVTGVRLADGSVLDADAVVIGPSFRPRAGALAGLDVTIVPHPSGLGDVVQTDPATGQTSVPGVYAAGNVADPSLQVLPAAARGGQVGAMIAFDLANDDLGAGHRTSGARTDWDHRYGGERPMWSGNPNGTLVGQVRDLIPGRALDVGAGEGADALWLAEQGWQVTAADISANALASVAAEAERRGLRVNTACVDANNPDAFDAGAYDLVSLQYGSFHRTPDARGLRNLLGAVAPGGTLLVVSHDLAPLREPADPAEQTRMYDPDAYVGVAEIAAALTEDEWQVDLHETRPRPAGAISTHHVDDVVLRAVRR